jgi:hypothetical protein
LGRDFSDVRVHADGKAAASARAVDAHAYTVGNHIVFGAGRYRPESSSGSRLLAHELIHTLQQGGSHPGGMAAQLQVEPSSGPLEAEADAGAAALERGAQVSVAGGHPLRVSRQSPGSPAPAGEFDDVLTEQEQRERAERRARVMGDAREQILDALRRRDISFLPRLRALNRAQRAILENDADFLATINGSLRGFSFWIVRLILKFGDHGSYPVYVRQLHAAVFGRDVQTIKDLLRSFPALTREYLVPGVRQMLDEQFRGGPDHAELVRLATETETARAVRGPETYQEVHYEQPAGGGPAQLQRFTGTTSYDLARTASELRVIVRIRFVDSRNPTQTLYPTDQKVREWRAGVEAAWNNRFSLFNGRTRLRVVFVPMFTEELPHFTVRVVQGTSFIRSDEGMWWLGADGLTVAHEFGHMIGNPDEYSLPGRIADIPASLGLSPLEARMSSVEGIRGTPRPTQVGGYDIREGIMSRMGSRAEPRHVWSVQSWFNVNLRQPGEPAFGLETR